MNDPSAQKELATPKQKAYLKSLIKREPGFAMELNCSVVNYLTLKKARAAKLIRQFRMAIDDRKFEDVRFKLNILEMRVQALEDKSNE